MVMTTCSHGCSSTSSSRAAPVGPRASLRVTAVSTGVLARPRPRTADKTGRDPAAAAPVGGGATGAQRTGTQQLSWFNKPSQAPGAPVEVAEPGHSGTLPILSFAGGGIFFWWMLGVLRYLHRNFDLSRVQLVGASAGGLVSTLAACGVDEDKAVRVAYRIAEEYGVFERPGGLAGIWGSLIRDWLEEILPEDAAELCRSRVRLVVTEVPSLRLRYLEDFESKQDLIDANMASVHIPFFLDGNAACTYRGRTYIDGSLWDFLLSDNSELIKCNGEACVIDYFNDDQLSRNRLDFIKLCSLEEVQAFVQTGYAYAERTDVAADNCFVRALGSVRKGPVRQLLETPVWGLRRALASID